MATIQDERQRLRERLAHLTRQAHLLEVERGQVDYALTVLNRLDADLTPVRRRGMTITARGTASDRVSTPALALTIFDEDTLRVWSQSDLMREMESRGWGDNVTNKVSAMQSALSRAVGAGQLSRVGPALYRRDMTSSEQDDLTDPEGPTAATVEPSVLPAPSREEESNGTAQAVDGHSTNLWQDRLEHHSGAPVEAVGPSS